MGILIDFILQGESKERRSEFNHDSQEDRLLGDDHFAEQSLEQIIEAVGTVYKMTPSMLAESGRRHKRRGKEEVRREKSLAILSSGFPSLFSLLLSSLNQAAGRLRKRMITDPALTARLDEVKKHL